MAHFDTHQVGCVEGRAIRRCGGEGTRAYAITLHATHPHNNPTLFAFMDRWDFFRFTQWVLGKGLRFLPSYDAHNTCSGNLNPPTKHHNHNRQGDNSLRHPSNGVCGRESCQACGGEGTHASTTTQHITHLQQSATSLGLRRSKHKSGA